MGGHVVFLDQFVDKPTLLEFIAMCDVYVTPYLNAAQMTSGTLATSFGMGKAVVSTPYWHARELLADEHGILVPFDDEEALAGAIAMLLTDEARRDSLRRKAYAASRNMTWPKTAERYVGLLQSVQPEKRMRILPPPERSPRFARHLPPPSIQLGHFMAMCDDTGIHQHAVYAVPDRAHGYCVDDNARALLVSSVLHEGGEHRLPEPMAARFAAFVQHAWNPDRRRFRNFLGFDRRWLEDVGSEDSHSRTLWALGCCMKGDASSSRRDWAAQLFRAALPAVLDFTSPRAFAFALLGINASLEARTGFAEPVGIRAELASRLMVCFTAVQRPGWPWFEAGLSYENARLPQALLVTGAATGDTDMIDTGLRSLRFLTDQQKNPAGQFRPVGTGSFFIDGPPQTHFDQQPVEVAATVAACLAAATLEAPANWRRQAETAFAWFHGENDLDVSLIDTVTGGCHDGLHADRANENQGAESVLCYLLAAIDIRKSARAARDAAIDRPLQALRG